MRRRAGATELARRGSTEEMATGADDRAYHYPLQPELECESIYD